MGDEGGGAVVPLTCFCSEVINPVCATPQTQTHTDTHDQQRKLAFHNGKRLTRKGDILKEGGFTHSFTHTYGNMVPWTPEP